MATNPYVNKVVYGNQTVMDISDTTVSASDVASGEVFYTGSGQRSVGTADYYSPNDTAETTIDDADYFPFYDTSATAKRKTLWSNIKAKLKTYFDTIYQSALTLPLSTANGGTGNADGYIRTGQKANTTMGLKATAEGYNTTASGEYSHAEGVDTVASGAKSHASGIGSIAAYAWQTVIGGYNDNKSNTLFEIGNGDYDFTHGRQSSNALEVYRDGHMNVNGDIYKNGKLYNDTATQGLLKDTVGWTGKNLLKITSESRTVHGVTFTVFKDENGNVLKVRANGTNDGTDNSNFSLKDNDTTRVSASALGFESNVHYIFSGCTGGSESTYFMMFNSSGTNAFICTNGEANDVFSSEAMYYPCIRVCPNQTVTNVDFYPMLRKATITDSTFEPYHESVKQTLRDAEVIEGKNRLKLSLAEIKTLNSGKTWSGDACTHNGITYTFNKDGEDNVVSVSTSGTATGFSYLRLAHVSSFDGSFLLNKGLSGNKFIYIQNETTNVAIAKSTGADDPVTLTPTSDNINVIIGINQGQTGTDTYYAMLRDITETDPSFEPYYIPLKDSKFDRAEQSVLGAKNQLDSIGYGYAGTGITATINSDGSLKVTHSGTSEGTYGLLNQSNVGASFLALKGKRITISGGKSATKKLVWYDNANNVSFTDDGNGITFVLPTTMTSFNLILKVSEDISNENFYPMVRLASDPDDTYVPYAMTNKELTDANEKIVAESYASSGTVTFSGVDDTAGGTHMYSVAFNVTSSSTQKAPYAELQSISGEGTSSMTLTYKTNADNGSSSNKNASLIRKIF